MATLTSLYKWTSQQQLRKIFHSNNFLSREKYRFNCLNWKRSSWRLCRINRNERVDSVEFYYITENVNSNYLILVIHNRKLPRSSTNNSSTLIVSNAACTRSIRYMRVLWQHSMRSTRDEREKLCRRHVVSYTSVLVLQFDSFRGWYRRRALYLI